MCLDVRIAQHDALIWRQGEDKREPRSESNNPWKYRAWWSTARVARILDGSAAYACLPLDRHQSYEMAACNIRAKFVHEAMSSAETSCSR